MIQLALWAFGSRGLQDLQILAFGDFSYRGRLASRARLFCRNSEATSSKLPFRYLKKNDSEFQQLVHKNLKMLGACSGESVLYENS